MDIFRVINPQIQKEQERIQHNSEAEKQVVTNLTPRSIESDCLWEMGNGKWKGEIQATTNFCNSFVTSLVEL